MKLKPSYITRSQQDRLYQTSIPIIGLTGGIATGKSTVSNLLKERGFSIIDADKMVKEVYELPETIKLLKDNWPETFIDGEIHFPTLREKFFKNPEVKTKLENHIYSLLPKIFNKNLNELGKVDFVIYDIPLLFEKNMGQLFDLTILVYAPRKIQLTRLVNRDGISEDMADVILSHQMDIEVKKGLADFVLDNSQDKNQLLLNLEKVITELTLKNQKDS